MSTETPYGSWPSPITAEVIVAASVGLGGPACAGGDLWWSELRPTEAGRVQIVRHATVPGPDDEPGAAVAVDVLPDGFSARTRVHEYGGGAWWLHDPDGGASDEGGAPEVTLYFANWADQRLYRVDHAGTDRAGAPVPITPEPDRPALFRYADGRVTADGEWIVCVREWHGDQAETGSADARNEIVAIRTDGELAPTVLVGGVRGPDFVSNPRLSPDGSTLSWLQWNHPDMPWDATELWVAGFDGGSHVATPSLTDAARVAGGADESITQPEWAPDGSLAFVSDRSGWWNAYRFAPGRPASGQFVGWLTGYRAEFGVPQWVFGQSRYAFGPDGDALFVLQRDGRDDLLYVAADAAPGATAVESSFTAIEGVVGHGDGFAFVGSSFAREPEVILISRPVNAAGVTTIDPRIVRPARDLGLPDGFCSEPVHMELPTTPDPITGEAATTFALFYPPTHPDVVGPTGALPPLVVMSHGGPTSAARSQLNLSVQFWTSRGFGVVDVNYRGSSGYGRAYRDALRGQWGILDVDDCIAAARRLASEGLVDGARLAIRGGSAGGFTTLCALTFHDEFTAGCSLYGIADLEALARDTHKFESRYLDRLIGPYPADRGTYQARSPIHSTDRLATPLLILQGLEDEVVPPAQAEMMADALRAKQVPFAYLAFAGEQHGFRQAANIRRALEAELYFYGRIFGFELVDEIEPVPIEFL